MKPKLSRSQRKFRTELLWGFLKHYSPDISQNLPWQILGKLIQDHPMLPSNVRDAVISVTEQKSVSGYLELQSFNEPQLYSSWAEYFSVTTVLSFLKKYPFGKVADIDPMQTALKKCFEAEKLCRMTNKRLKWFRTRGYRHSNRWQGVHSIFHTARLMINGWLGPLDLNEIHAYMRHGPGGAIGVTGSDTTSYFKYGASRYSVSTRALPYAEAAILSDQLWRRYVFSGEVIGEPIPTALESRQKVRDRLEVVNYNKVTFVPKTALTHRAIAIEPLMNIYLQLGVGDLLTEKLRLVGCNLRSQERNQKLACEGSCWEGAAEDRPVTLDLSMASDTLSIELVRELLPEDWFDLLDCLRSPSGLLDGQVRPWAKFSSMGNGFTFQLESMIFFALSLSVAKHLNYARKSVAVYGDDIIVPAGMALTLVDTLAYSGFRVNTEKSCFTGQFRESCGADWFDGRNVRPFFLKRKIQNAKDLVFVFNSIRSSCLVVYQANDCVFTGSSIYQYIRARLPSSLVKSLLGPRTEDLEGHLHCSLDEGINSPFVLWDVDLQTWSYASVKAIPRKYFGIAGPLYLQFMSRDSLGRDISPILNGSARNLALVSRNWVAEPINLGSVTRRKDVRLALATQTSNGWRND